MATHKPLLELIAEEENTEDADMLLGTLAAVVKRKTCRKAEAAVTEIWLAELDFSANLRTKA